MIPSGPEAFVVLAVIILLFGAKKLPELAGSVGKSIKEFRKASKDAMDDDDASTDDAAVASTDDAAVVPTDDAAVVPTDDEA